MKLVELLGVKKFNDMTSSEVLDFIKDLKGDKKFKAVGDGANAVALENGGIIYKFWLKDSAYEEFINYALHHQDNPFLPKLKSKIKTIPVFFKKPDENIDSIKYIKMEKLYSDSRLRSKKYKISTASNHEITLEHMVHFASKSKGSLKTILEELVDYCHDWDVVNVKNIEKEIIFLAAALVDIFRIIEDSNDAHFPDFNANNFMERDNGQVVIIDPIVNSGDLNINTRIRIFNDKNSKAKSTKE